MKHLLFAFALLFAAACGGETSAPAAEKTTSSESVIEVGGLYIAAPLGGRDVTSGGGEISVSGAPVDLVSASSPDVRSIELHTHEIDDGVMKMRKTDKFFVAENAPLLLGSGGPHLMLFGVSKDLEVGDELDISLVFKREDGSEIVLVETAVVQPFSAVGRGS